MAGGTSSTLTTTGARIAWETPTAPLGSAGRTVAKGTDMCPDCGACHRDGPQVDLNRNYPFGWDFSCGGSATMSSNTYRGPAAGSEPEMQTMVAWQVRPPPWPKASRHLSQKLNAAGFPAAAATSAPHRPRRLLVSCADQPLPCSRAQASRKFAKLVDLHSSGRDVRQNYAECAELPERIDTEYTSIVSTVAAVSLTAPLCTSDTHPACTELRSVGY